MRSMTEHVRTCLDAVGPLPPLAVALVDAAGCVLAADVVTPVDLPLSDQAAFDGYAVRAADSAGADAGPVSLPVTADVLPGDAGSAHLVEAGAVRISSGAPLPPEADAVVPLEATDRGEARVELYRAVRAGDGVRPRARDAAAGDVVMRAGLRVGPREIALLAAMGRGRADVHPKPRVVIVPVGDELVEAGRTASPGQVFDANGHALAAGIADAGGVALRVPAVPDRRGELAESLRDQLVRADLVITTGGLSLGRGDTVKDVVGSLGEVRFDDVAVAPGRRFGVGWIGEPGDETPVFCLPGDPAAVQVALESFVRPALLKMAGYSTLFRPTVQARLVGQWVSEAGVREFLPARILGSPADGYRVQVVEPARGLTGLVGGNALAVVAEETVRIADGDPLPCLILAE